MEIRRRGGVGGGVGGGGGGVESALHDCRPDFFSGGFRVAGGDYEEGLIPAFLAGFFIAGEQGCVCFGIVGVGDVGTVECARIFGVGVGVGVVDCGGGGGGGGRKLGNALFVAES